MRRPACGNAAFCPSCGEAILLGGPIVYHWTMAQAEELQYTNSQLGDSSCAPAAILSSLNMIGCLPQDASERLSLTDSLMRLVRARACKCRHTSIKPESKCDVPLHKYLLARGACGGGGSRSMIDLVEEKCPQVVGAALNIGDLSPFARGELLEWMGRWMQDGAGLTMTMNRFRVHPTP